jgi:hypothetical protein
MMDGEMLSFLGRLISCEGRCSRDQLPPADRPQDRARQKCKRLGWATYSDSYWRITGSGRRAVADAKDRPS